MRRRYPLPTSSGLLTIVIYLTFSLIAYGYYPTAFRPWGNWLSDLGNRTLSPQGAVYYRTAAVLTGAMLALFFVALAAWFRQQRRKSRVFMGVALLFGLIGALALILTGVFSEDRATPHSVFSAVLYISFGTAVWFVGWAFLSVPTRTRTLSYVCFAVVPAVWAFSAFPRTYWLEWVVVFLLLLFVGSVAWATSRLNRRLAAGQRRDPQAA